MEQIRNVFCVGRNYKMHAEELGNNVPENPIVFQKPTHTLVEMNDQNIILPSDQGEIHYEAELVLIVSRTFQAGMKIGDVVKQIALGIDFTLRDVQNKLTANGLPWLEAKGFVNSAPLSAAIDFPGTEALEETDFTLHINGKCVQRGNVGNMIFPLQRLVEHISGHYGLSEGDIIFTGTPAGVGPVSHGDRLELFLGERRLGGFSISI